MLVLLDRVRLGSGVEEEYSSRVVMVVVVVGGCDGGGGDVSAPPFFLFPAYTAAAPLVRVGRHVCNQNGNSLCVGGRRTTTRLLHCLLPHTHTHTTQRTHARIGHHHHHLFQTNCSIRSYCVRSNNFEIQRASGIKYEKKNKRYSFGLKKTLDFFVFQFS